MLKPASPTSPPSSPRAAGRSHGPAGTAGAAAAASVATNNGSESLSMLPISLTFRRPAVEAEYLMQVAKSRWPTLAFIFCFDIACYMFRFLAKLITIAQPGRLWASAMSVTAEMGPQLANMVLLYTTISFLNRRSRKHGDTAARQEELLLSVLMAMAICNLLASLSAGTAQDYVYSAFFLICTTTFLKIRWWVGTLVLSTPVVLLLMWQQGQQIHVSLPADALVHISVAWAVGGLMAYLAEWYRRQMYSSQRQAAAAHQKELLEAQARVRAQRQLAAAQAQAAQRALVVAREKAAHEAQIEFMSLMCHEVRTPLNGCLASAEMLLETNLCQEQRELANTIRVSGSILLSTVSNFLDFFKMEAGKTLDIVRSEVDLLQLVQDVHCIIEAMVGRNGEVRLLHPEVHLISGQQPSLGLLSSSHMIVCDPDRVRGILLNLYTNAAKFTKQGHIGLRVTEVSGYHDPSPSEGYSSVTVTPAYQPATQNKAGHVKAGAGVSMLDTEGEQDKAGIDGDATGTASSTIDASDPPMSDTLSILEGTPDNTPATPVAASGSGSRLDTLSLTGRGQGLSDQAQLHRHTAFGDEGGLAKLRAVSDPQSTTKRMGSQPSKHSQQDAVSVSPTEATTTAGSNIMGMDTDSKWLLFEVMDTGVGITPEGLQSLFKEYCQGTEDDMRKPRSKGGTGLGLSICSKQVAVLGGRIGAYSCPGRGSVFWFTIPLILAQSNNTHSSAAELAPFSQPLPQQEPLSAAQIVTSNSASHSWWAQGSPETATQLPATSKLHPVSSLTEPHVPVLDSTTDALPSVPATIHPLQSSCPWMGQTSSTHTHSSQQSFKHQRIQSILRPTPRPSVSIELPPHFTMDPEQSMLPSSMLQRQLASMSQLQGNIGDVNSLRPSTDFGSLQNSMGRGMVGSSPQLEAEAGFAQQLNPHFLEHLQQPTSYMGGLREAAESANCPGTFPTPQHSGFRRIPSNQSFQGCGSPSQAPPSHINLGGSTAAVHTNPLFLRPSIDTLSGFPEQPPLPSSAGLPPSATPGAPMGGSTISLLRNRKVLLVEDNLINQTVAKKMLAGLGMQCTVASNGLEAVKAVEASMNVGDLGTTCSSFDVVLMDMMMPVMGGVEATKAIRALESKVQTNPWGAEQAKSPQAASENIPPSSGGSTLPTSTPLQCRVPILAMTANASDRDREECRAAGMDGFLSKPVLKDRLADAIIQVLAGGTWQDGSAKQ